MSAAEFKATARDAVHESGNALPAGARLVVEDGFLSEAQARSVLALFRPNTRGYGASVLATRFNVSRSVIRRVAGLQ